ncbi:MAG: hypothetical protein ACI80P_000105 [Flavobacteriales bacterium]|jgi:hypothetical protein
MANRLITLVFALGCSLVLSAQKDDPVQQQQMIEQRIEAIVENLDEGVELDYTTLFDELNFRLDHPLNLNKASEQDLRQLYLLSDVQILGLFEHIRIYGELTDIFELQAVRGWDLVTIYFILPFVQVDAGFEAGNWTLKNILEEGSSDLFIRYTRVLEEQRGYSAISDEELSANPGQRYLGSQDKLYTRYRFRYRNNLSIGFTAEKDAGEEFFRGSQKNGFDFYSAHVYYEEKGWVRKVALGDYQAQFGQGLTLWSGLGFGKSPFLATAKRNAIGIRPYTAVDENLFFRGGAVTLGKGNAELTLLYSSKDIDANIVASDTVDSEVLLSVSSFQLSGMHRTANELFDKDAIRERHMGGNLAWRTRQFSIGFTGIASQWEADLSRNLQLYNQFEFNQNKNFVGGIDYNFVRRNFNFFGETSMSQNGGLAMVNGVLVALDKRLSMAIVQRKYDRDFQSVYSSAFAENSRPKNESGVYVGVEFSPVRKWQFTGYVDQFKFPWLSFGSDAPTSGHEYLLQLTHKPSRSSEFYVRWRKRQKNRNTSLVDTPIDFPVEWTQENFRIHASYKAHENLQFKTRVEWTSYQLTGGEKEKGFLLYQDLIFRKIGSPFNLTLRYALFDTDSYNSRIYAYENDVLYFFSIPAYANSGSRFFVVSKINVRKGLDLWIRYARWMYLDTQEINSGLDQIQGDSKSEVRLQMRLRF